MAVAPNYTYPEGYDPNQLGGGLPDYGGTSVYDTGGLGTYGSGGTYRQTNYTPYTSTTTSSGGGGTSEPTQEAPQPDPFLEEINKVFDPAYAYLNQAKDTISGQLPGVQQEIRDQYNVSANQAGRAKDEAIAQVDTSQTGGEQRRADALNSARRLFNELQRGGQQRFGGSSSAGEAYNTLAGTELQRNRAGIEQNFGNFMTQIQQARTAISNKYQSAIENLELQKNQSLAQARRDFENKLLEIDRLKSELESNKAQMKLQALQDLRNQVFQINLAKASTTQALTTQANQAQKTLDLYTQQAQQGGASAQQAGNVLGANTTTNPLTSNTITETGSKLSYSPTGRRDDDLVGAVSPFTTPRDELFA